MAYAGYAIGILTVLAVCAFSAAVTWKLVSDDAARKHSQMATQHAASLTETETQAIQVGYRSAITRLSNLIVALNSINGLIGQYFGDAGQSVTLDDLFMSGIINQPRQVERNGIVYSLMFPEARLDIQLSDTPGFDSPDEPGALCTINLDHDLSPSVVDLIATVIANAAANR